MEIDSQKPKEWVGITNEPSIDSPLFMCVCSYARALLACHVCFALPMSYSTSPYPTHVYYVLLLLYYDLIPLDLEGSNYKTWM
jgi:hypothetical protein